MEILEDKVSKITLFQEQIRPFIPLISQKNISSSIQLTS